MKVFVGKDFDNYGNVILFISENKSDEELDIDEEIVQRLNAAELAYENAHEKFKEAVKKARETKP